MSKIVFITMHYVDNYGSVLQTLATQLIFQELGHEAFVLDYVRANCKSDVQASKVRGRYLGKRWPFCSALGVWLLMKRYKYNTAKHKRMFDDFRDKYFQRTREYLTVQDIYADVPEADIYCTGSDQTWNSIYNGGILPEYFLDFAPDGKPRLAFSASIGRTDLDNDEVKKTTPLVAKYNAISVRESSALRELEKMGFDKGVHIVDPTLTISGQDWLKVLSIQSRKQKPYVLVYQLNFNPDMLRFARRLAKENNLQLLVMNTSIKARFFGGHQLGRPKVEEWVSLFANAEYVVTDSFHGTAFSLNFNRKLFVWYPPEFSTRLQSILAMVGAEHRVIDNKDVDWRKIAPIDYEYVNEVLARERQKARDFLVGAIGRG